MIWNLSLYILNRTAKGKVDMVQGQRCQGMASDAKESPYRGYKPLRVWRLVALCQGLCHSACHVPETVKQGASEMVRQHPTVAPSGLDIAGPFLGLPPLKTYGSYPFGSAYAKALHPHRLNATVFFSMPGFLSHSSHLAI